MGIPTVQSSLGCRHCGVNLTGKDSFAGYCFCCLLNSATDDQGELAANLDGRFDHYEIATDPDGSFIELGRGAMGITYQALDTTLRFPVALKAIQSPVAKQPVARERFLREARAAARLRHPNVASVLYFGVREQGQCFYTMELVDGETLAARVQRSGPLPAPDAVEIISQVAAALEAAEKQGLVHRDLKPGNLMLVDGTDLEVKVIDFGLAKALNDDINETTLTEGGFVGTPAFASPELFSGEEIDARSDFYSLGATLWFLLCAKAPFRGQNAAEIHSRQLHDKPAVSDLKAAHVSQPAIDLACSLLQIDPSKRPQSAEALRKAVRQCQLVLKAGSARRFLNRRFLLRYVAPPVAAAVLGGLFFLFRGQSPPSALTKSIAVLPFENLSANQDNAYFGAGVQTDILARLAKVTALNVTDRGSVLTYRDFANRPSSREIGQALGVGYLLNGSVGRDDRRVRVTVELVETKSGREVWAETYDRDLSDIFAIQSEIAQKVVEQLQVKLSSTEKAAVDAVPTHDLMAYEVYLRARDLILNSRDDSAPEPYFEAARLLEDATYRDPNFAIAWRQLAVADDSLYLSKADHSPGRRAQAEAAIATAMRLQPNLPDIHLEMAIHLFSTERDVKRAYAETKIAAEKLPNPYRAYILMADFECIQGRWSDALQHYQKAYDLFTQLHTLAEPVIRVYQRHRQYDQARQWLDKAAATGSSSQAQVDETRAAILWQEKGDTSPFQTLFDDPSGNLHPNGIVTPLKVQCALAERNFVFAEKILDADPTEVFSDIDGKLTSRNELKGWIARSAGDETGAKQAYENARHYYQAEVQKWADDPFPLMSLAICEAALGQRQEAIEDARKAAAMRPLSEDAIDGAALLVDQAQVYLWAGDEKLALEQLLALENTPCALNYGFLRKVPTWDALKGNPEFEQLLSRLKPIPIVNEQPGGK
jgi:serine/threonine protein kinase/tetratricopeptide (TPR) repeat protein